MAPKISVIGAGSWGTTLASLLSEKGHEVRLWVYEPDLAFQMQQLRENPVYLPGYKLPQDLHITSSLDEAMKGHDTVVFVVPTHFARTVLTKLSSFVTKKSIIVSATKGIEENTLLLMSGLFKETLPDVEPKRLAFLSGPSFAKEVIEKLPTAVSLGYYNSETGRYLQEIFTTAYFRVYTNPDVIGIQIGGALKNVIALASGASDGLGLGSNARAALITRGLAEITRLGVSLGADPLTFSGLSGLGDLILTCTGELSRNRMVGYRLAQGEKLDKILKEMKMVAEGIRTSKAAHELAKRQGVQMPITEQVYAVLYEGKEPKQAVTELMARLPREEKEAWIQGL